MIVVRDADEQPRSFREIYSVASGLNRAAPGGMPPIEGVPPFMIPTFILRLWLLGLLSLGIVGTASYLCHEWYQRSWRWDFVGQHSIFNPDLGLNEPTWMLIAALLLLAVAFSGKSVFRAIHGLTRARSRGNSENDSALKAPPAPSGAERIKRPDGSELVLKFYGPLDAPAIVLTHGWGMDNGEWIYLKRELTDRFRLVVWDEPGLGESSPPANGDYSLEKLANDLDAVLSRVGAGPAVLLGHSIGGMITLTFCRLFPEALGSRVAGLVLTHTTYTNPVRTTKGAALYTPIERPVLVPLMYLTIWLSPVVRLMNWLSYRNGSAHLMTKRSSFAGSETWEQVDFAARFQAKASPAVVARGMLGMMKYDATAVLAKISVPTLVVEGDRDPTCTPEASKRIHSEVPTSRLLTLSPAKHLGLIEHHASYVKGVREFAIPLLGAK